MTFQNGYHGVKKVFTAQILKIISSILMLAGSAILLAAASAEMADSMLFVSLVLLIAGFVVSLIAYIINIVGLHQSGKDDYYMQTAFYFAIFALIINAVSIIFSALNVGGGVADNISTTFTYLCDIVIILHVVRGIGSFAEQLGDEKIISLGNKLFILIAIMITLGAITSLLPVFFGTSDSALKVEGVFALVSSLAMLVAYIVYLVYLGKGVKMLKNK